MNLTGFLAATHILFSDGQILNDILCWFWLGENEFSCILVWGCVLDLF